MGNGDLADMFPPPPLPARNGDLANGGGGGGSVWNTARGDIHAAQSYRDVRDVTAIALSQSRENTLSRDLVNHHSVREEESEWPSGRDSNGNLIVASRMLRKDIDMT